MGDSITIIDRPVRITVRSGGNAGVLQDHLTGPADRHDASAISVTAYDIITGTNVQAGLQQLNDKIRGLTAAEVAYANVELPGVDDVAGAMDALLGGTGLADNYVTLATAQTITGSKTFSTDVIVGGTTLSGAFPNITGNNNLNLFAEGTGRIRLWSLGVERARLAENGNFTVGPPAASPAGRLAVQTDAGIVGIAVRGAAAQTANLQEWQDSTGTVRSNIKSDGTGQFRYADVGPAPAIDAMLRVVPDTAGRVAAIIRGSASQTADLQQWQDSTGTVLGSIAAGGQVKINGLDSTGSWAKLGNPHAYFTGGVVGIGNTPNSDFGLQVTAGGQASIRAVSSTSTVVAIIARGAALQTADLQQWQNSSGTAVSSIRHDGQIRTTVGLVIGASQATGSGGVGATLSVEPTYSAAQSPLVVKGIAAQTGDLTQWQNSAGTALARVDSLGVLTAAQVNSTIFRNSTDNNNIMRVDSSSQSLIMGNAASVRSILIWPGAAASVPLRVQGAAAQTADLQQWQNSAGTVLASIKSNGLGEFASGLDAYGSARIFGNNNGVVPAIVRGAAAQTANLQEWQNSTGTILARVDAYGNVGAPNFTSQANVGTYLNLNGSSVRVVGRTATDINLIVQAVDAQTADLTRWQNSAGTVLTRIESGGAIQTQQDIKGRTIYAMGATANYYGAHINVQTQDAGILGIVIRGAAGQSADLQQWQDSAGTVRAKINANHVGYFMGNVDSSRLVVGPAGTAGIDPNTLFVTTGHTISNIVVVRGAPSHSGDLTQWQNSAGTVLAKVTAGGRIESTSAVATDTIEVGSAGNMASHVNVIVTNAANKGVTVRGAAAQTADLQQWQNSAGTTLSRVAASGQVQANAGLQAIPANASVVAILAKAYPGQTADLQQWQDSAGTVLTKIDSFGALRTAEIVTVGSTTAVGSATLQVVSRLAGNVGHMVRGAALQTGDLTQWQNSAGTVLAGVDADGRLRSVQAANFGGFPAGSTYLGVRSLSAAIPVAIVQGAVGQTANLQEWQNSAGTVLAQVAADGRVNVLTTGTAGAAALNVWTAGNTGIVNTIIRGSASQTADLQQWQNSAGTVLAGLGATGDFTVGGNVLWATNTAGAVGAGALLTANAAGQRPLLVRGAASQTADLQQWQNSAGTVIGAIGATGNVGVGTGTGDTRLFINAGANPPGRLVLGVRGAELQSGDLQQWQDSAATVLLRISPNGWIGSAGGDTYINNPSSPNNRFTAVAAAHVPVVVKAAATQTADLQQWQNSAGTVLAYMTANGGLNLGPSDNVPGNGDLSVSSEIRIGLSTGYSYLSATALNTTHADGLKIMTTTTQKLGFWGATPVAQPAGVADAVGGLTIDVEARAAVNAVISRLETIGLLATV